MCQWTWNTLAWQSIPKQPAGYILGLGFLQSTVEDMKFPLILVAAICWVSASPVHLQRSESQRQLTAVPVPGSSHDFTPSHSSSSQVPIPNLTDVPARGPPHLSHFPAMALPSQPVQGLPRPPIPIRGPAGDFRARPGIGNGNVPGAAGSLSLGWPSMETPIWGNRPVDRHFDSVAFCQKFVGLSEKPITSMKSLKSRFANNYDVMKCVMASELVALPHNLVQDVRWVFTEISRQFDPLSNVGHAATLPFVMGRTIAAMPVRIFAEFFQLSRRFLESQHQLISQFTKK